MKMHPSNHDDRLVWDTWLSMHKLPVLTVADEVGLFAALASNRLSTQDLARTLVVDARALKIHLRLLAAMGFVAHKDDRWFATDAARSWLNPDSPGYYGPVLCFYAKTNPLHTQLLETLATGGRAETHISVTDTWEAGEMSAEAAQRITAYMNVYGYAAAIAAGQHPAFARTTRLLDVGGGSAVFSIALAKQWPQLTATVLDLDPVCTVANRYVAKAELSDKIDTHASNMFMQRWPQGYDTHFLSNIFHDWAEESCLMLARRSFEALPAGGRIILHEMLMDDDGCGPLHAAIFSLVMLLGTKGRQYSFSELTALLTEAGFVQVETSPTQHGYYSITSAQKP